MDKAVSYLMEPLLTQFFLIDAICRGFLNESRRMDIFGELARVFCVPMDDRTRAYFALADSPVYKNIADYADYERLCRTIEFAQKSGQSVELTQEDRVILAQKREAMQIKSELFKQSKNLTTDTIADTLLNTAMNGNVDAMVTVAFMEYHGICMGRDPQNAVKRLGLCAKWNNLFGNLMGIAYDSSGAEEYYNTLHTVLRSGNQRDAFEYICRFSGYVGYCVKNPVARIMEKAFGMGIIRRNTYDPIFAKVAFSPLIGLEDKEKLLLSKKKEAIVSLSDIPFDVERESDFSFDRVESNDLPLRREDELHNILCGIWPATHHRLGLYRPLLVAGDDGYVADMYLNALKAGFDENNPVFEVDAGTLSPQDFYAAKEHFVLRGLSETKCSHTVFLVKQCDELRQDMLPELIKLLDYDYRCKFKLVEPTVSMDLSDVLIVLFASQTNETVRKLAEECETVWTRRINEDEKQQVIDAAFAARAKSFGMEQAVLEQAGKDYLAPFKTGQMLRLIDGALKKVAYENGSVITLETLKEVARRQNVSSGRREFGYLGGGTNESH